MSEDVKIENTEKEENDGLIPDIPTAPGDGDGDDYALLTKCSTEIEADMIAANLEGAGIESYILRQNDSSFPVMGNLSVVKIYVPRARLSDAREYLSNSYDQSGDEDEHV